MSIFESLDWELVDFEPVHRGRKSVESVRFIRSERDGKPYLRMRLSSDMAKALGDGRLDLFTRGKFFALVHKEDGRCALGKDNHFLSGMTSKTLEVIYSAVKPYETDEGLIPAIALDGGVVFPDPNCVKEEPDEVN